MKTNKYLMIYQEISQQIERGEWAPGVQLPSENELAERYETSRETIRKALTLLAQRGFIQKIRGKGSIVLDLAKFDFPVSGLVSFKELALKSGKSWKTKVHEVNVVSPDRFLQQQLKVKKEDSVWKVTRVREMNGEKIILDKDFFNQRYVTELTYEICENSVYEYIENDLGLNISFAKKEIVVEQPTEEDRALLSLEGFHNIVVVKNHVYLDDASLLQYTESRHRPDKFRFVDFARRNH
ncbi:GntR family transcriptional regulator, trehalose operon transcriptional repressor [Fictibacillus solisalsi]|uniref:Trehalose operon repressor n=1 Tax=Fictibacillus solisalsi TaxID=459525 RepID=A0A1G9XMK6_9BACL|nr:trehalose operon repressor [Fictibacillus solisalsi]SDM97960.1 GntR family transcriptional regulator, trehalose operon transcriptional repressor [Fictibacillus solisalsi]